ncbi:MAG: HAMP domain-containing protein, partial [Chrysiogenales bacterium]
MGKNFLIHFNPCTIFNNNYYFFVFMMMCSPPGMSCGRPDPPHHTRAQYGFPLVFFSHQVRMMVYFDSIYQNFSSVSALVPCAFMVSMGLILLFIPNKSHATLHLGLTYLLIALFMSSYVMAAMLYHPVTAYHRWITVGSITLCTIHFILFLIHYPDNRNPVLARRLGILLYAASISLTAAFVIFSLKAGTVYNFDGHHFDLKTYAINTPIAFIILLLLMVMLVIGVSRTVILNGPERWTLLAITLVTFATLMAPVSANILSRYGSITRSDFQFIRDTFIITGFFVVFVIYLNTTRERTSLMVKFMGISLATFLIILQGLSYISLADLEDSYDQIRRRDLLLAIEAGEKPSGLLYLVGYSLSDREPELLVRTGGIISRDDLMMMGDELFNTAMREEIVAMWSLRGADFSLGLKEILESDNPYFAGYASAITSLEEGIPASEPDRAGKLTREIDRLQGSVRAAATAIRRLPEEGFKERACGYLEEIEGSMAPLSAAMLDCCRHSGLEGAPLRREILRYLAPMHPAEGRHYRAIEGPIRHVTAYSHFDAKRQSIYEAGFDYRLYRAYLHPTAMKYVIMTGILLLTVFGGFHFFFMGAFINPIRRILDAIHRVREGHYDIIIPPTVRNELGYISHNFNEMMSTLSLSKEVLSEYAENLAKMVSERTEELAKARDELWGEMQIAQKMQTIMTPRNPRMKGYRITGYMLSADMMGGDYYDVINMEGTDWVIIGDVSGHGVPAGIIMMMVHTSIRAILLGGASKTPAELLGQVNAVITENIKMVGDDRYMTVTLMAFRENGDCTFTGLHQDILIYRSRAEKIEIVRSDGIWLGILEHTEGLITQKRIHM